MEKDEMFDEMLKKRLEAKDSLTKHLDKAVAFDNAKIAELESYKRKLQDVLSEIEYTQNLYKQNIANNESSYNEHMKRIENGNWSGWYYMEGMHNFKQTGVLKRAIQNLEEYSRRFRNSFKTV